MNGRIIFEAVKIIHITIIFMYTYEISNLYFCHTFFPQAMYNFWKKSAEWNNTWSGDNTALQVDYIKVEAI